ncbi:MFS transporter [Litchfieldella rifensis]|uniref:MFS transporter n=1 Tax=Litchfieldella rifensis TaxID=762643 RepID=A0ABV7LLT0_9GAMM
MSRSVQPGRLSARRVILWAGLLLGLSLVLMAWTATRLFEADLKPEFESRSQLIGAIVREDLESALDLGLELGAIAGTEAYLDQVIAQFEEVERITLLDRAGTEVAVATRNTEAGPEPLIRPDLSADSVTHMILRRNTIIGELRIDLNPHVAETHLTDVFLDIGVIGLIAVLLSFELVIWVTAGAVGKPLDRVDTLLRQQVAGQFTHVIPPRDAGSLARIAWRLSDRAQDVAARQTAAVKRLGQAYFVDVRMPAFLFSLGTEISTAFMPIYAREAGGAEWLAGDLAATAPLVTYLLALAIIAPFGGTLTDRIAPRDLFLTCVPLTAAAMVGVGLSGGVLGIAFWHGVMALIYGVATVACLEYAIRTAPEDADAQAVGSFLFVLIAGAFCGSALGGVLADRMGPAPTFFVGAGLVFLSGLLGAGTLVRDVGKRTTASEQVSQEGHGWAVFANLRVPTLILGVAVPVNVGMSVFVWYLVPVILDDSGTRMANIGRVVMLYFLARMLGGPVASRLADGRIGRMPLLFAGMALAAVAFLSLSFWSGIYAMALSVVILGIGNAICDAPQYAEAIKLAETSDVHGARNRVLGTLRLVERLAAIAGLLACAMVVETVGYDQAVASLGWLMLAGLVVLAAGRLVPTRRAGEALKSKGDIS